MKRSIRFEAALAEDYENVRYAFACVDVEMAQAGDEDDEKMIKEQVGHRLPDRDCAPADARRCGCGRCAPRAGSGG
jgi:hypothetical protein